ncbi:hypothetical protein ACFX5L_02190 [Bacteroides sp. KG123]
MVKDLLDLPILYLSRYIIDNKAEYYKQIQDVRESGDWEPWILFTLNNALIALLTNQKEHIGLSPEEIIESVTI